MIYIGKYYSDIVFSSEFFEMAILLYKPLYSCDNIEISWFSDKTVRGNLLNMDFAHYVANILMKRNVADESCLCYDHRTAINIMRICPSLRTKFIGAKVPYIDWLNNKTTTRLWLSPEIQTPAIGVLTGNECTYNRLNKMYPKKRAFIIQSEISSGGKETFLFTNENEKEIYDSLKRTSCYLVSPLIEDATTYNVHICISDKQYWISPVSKQVSDFSEYHPLYAGSVFNNIYITKIVEQLNFIARKLKDTGFRGICGIDFMLSEDEFIYIECNNRLQGSSAALDYLLRKNNFPSLYQLLVATYNGDPLPLMESTYKQTYCSYFTNSNINKAHASICLHEVPMYRHWNFEKDI